MLYFTLIVDLCHLRIWKEQGREKKQINPVTAKQLINYMDYLLSIYLTNISLESNFWTLANNANPERTPHLAATDQDLHNLLAEISTCT